MFALTLAFAHLILLNPTHAIILPSSSGEIRSIQESDVLKKTYAYNEFFNALFSDQNLNHSFDMDRAYLSAGRDRIRQSLGPQLLGINDAFNNAPLFKGGAQMLWLCGVLFSVFQLPQDPSLLPQWIFGYPVIVDILLRLSAGSMPGLSRTQVQNLMATLKWPLEHTQSEETVWYQLGNRNEEVPRIVEAVVSFDVLERLVTKVFSNGQPNRYGSQIEKFLFRYANRFRPALQGWLLRYLQANPDGLRGTKTVFPWQQAFELHLRSRPFFWRSVLQELNAEVADENKDLKKALAQLDSDLGSIPSVWSGAEMRYRRGCEFLLQWVSDFR